MAILRTFTIVVLAFSLLAGACSDDAPTGVVFGDGEVPETVPEDFPIPEGANIGSTLIDYDNDIAEMAMIIPAAIPAVVAYYETNLPTAGYTITSSAGTQAEWTIEFNDNDVAGSVVMRVGGPDLTSAVARFTAT